MSALLLAIGFILFSCGAFGLYAGTSEKGALALKVREALEGVMKAPKTALIIFGACAAAAGFCLVLWGYIKAKRDKKSRAGISIHIISVLGMLIAMTIMLDRFPGLSIKTHGWKIGFSFFPPMLAAILYGPLEAAIVYALSDLVGALLFPFGPYHPGFTAVAGLMGFVFGVFLNRRPFAFAKSKFEWKKIRFFPNQLVPVLINALVLGLIVNTFWVSQLYGSKTYGEWFVYRLLEYAILVPVELLLTPALLNLAERIKKNSLFGSRGAAAVRSAEHQLKLISKNVSIPGLSRVTELLRLMGDPQENTRVVHVAGTNGKGSFVAMLSSVLKAAGYTVGSFSSPAITGVTDSFRINGGEISGGELEKLLAEIEPFCAQMNDKPTEFEVLAAAAYLLFNKKHCDIAVVECGMGGSLDATNVLSAPLLSVITNIQLDHCSYLGDTVAEIASHKAGIIKQGRPVLFGGDDEEAYSVIAAAAEKSGSRLYRTDASQLKIISADLTGTSFAYGDKGEYFISLLGAYQPRNAANVLEAVGILRKEGVSISDEAVACGLESARWHGRFEIVSKRPCVIFDGSHNPDGVVYAAESIKTYFPDKKVVLLMGVMADKDYSVYPETLAPVAEKLFAVCPDNPRALPAQRLAECFAEAGIDSEAHADLSEGVAAAYAYALSQDLPLVAMGTLYMYSAFREAFDAVQRR